ncbi:MAG: hypothetical protein ACJAVV_002847 [Alphaproteobacteria bacterium]|jgi:hypothetical protein
MIKKSLLLMSIFLFFGCTSAVDRHSTVRIQLDQKVNCKSAVKDIAMLKEEKASTQEKLANGIATVLPTSVVFNLLTGEFTKRRSIATGEFDQMLYMKIDMIESECGLPSSTPSMVAR